MPTPTFLRRPAVLALALLTLTVVGCDSSEPEPTTGSISGTISLPQGAAGDINNTRVALFDDIDSFRNNVSTVSTTADASGAYTFENLNPDSYFLAAFKDNDNNGVISGGDFYGYLGGGPLEPEQATPQSQTVVAGESYQLGFVIQIVPPGFGVSVTGTYAGTGNNFTLTLTLTETSGAVTGSGTINVGQSVPLTVSGTFNAPNVNLTLSNPQFDPIQLTGTVSDNGSSINATLNGSGFNNEAVTLNLQ